MVAVRQTSSNQAFDTWIHSINQACGRFRADTQPGDFSGSLESYEGGAIRASMVDASNGTRLYRTQAEARQDETDKLFAVLQLRGQTGIAQHDAQTLLVPGDLALVDAAYPFSVKYFDHSRQISLILPRQAVERNMRATRIRCAERVPAASSVAGLARRLMLDAIRQTRYGLGQQESEAALDALVHLLRPAIGYHSNAQSGSTCKLQRALAFIEENIDTDTLGPESIAGAIGVSVRGLYRLFATQGLVVAQYIRNRRLDLCAETLRQTGCPQKLAAVGYTWGFSDPSHFSTAFKTRFGLSPSDYRRHHGFSSQDAS